MSFYAKIDEASRRYGERLDCVARSIAVACGVTYEEAHAMLTKCGRKRRSRTKDHVTRRALRLLGFAMVQYPVKGRTVRTVERELPVGRRFIVRVNGHMLPVRGGKVWDWSAGRLFRVREVLEIVPRERLTEAHRQHILNL